MQVDPCQWAISVTFKIKLWDNIQWRAVSTYLNILFILWSDAPA